MAVETYLSNDNELRYSVDEHGRRTRRTQQDIEIILLGRKFSNFLAHSSLSDADKQRLRSLSADYAQLSTQLPVGRNEEYDYDAMRRSALEYFSSDLPVSTEEVTGGLRRSVGSDGSVTIKIDDRDLTVRDIELMYAIIEPSTDVLDRATQDAAYFYVPNATDDRFIDALPDRTESEESAGPAEYDIDQFEPDDMPSIEDGHVLAPLLEVPAIEDMHTLRDELRPLTDRLSKIGGTVIFIGRRRPATNRTDQQKIAS